MDITLKDIIDTKKPKGNEDFLPIIEKNLSLINSIMGNVEKLEKYKHIKEFLQKTKGGAELMGDSKQKINNDGSSSTDTYNKLVNTLEQLSSVKGDGYTVKELLKDIRDNKEMVIKAL